MSLIKNPEDYSPETIQSLLTQWSVCVSEANSTSDRRMTTNNIYITVNAAFVALMSFVNSWHNLIIALIGICVSGLWMSSIRSYKKLNAAKYAVIYEIEKYLPAAPSSAEWDILEKDRKYRKLTTGEYYLPVIFILLYICIPLLAYLMI